MKITDLINGELPHLYLDMDGVQADFFGNWAKFHGVPHYSNIQDPEASIDVLAATGAESIYRFFRDLPALPGGMRVVRWLHQHRIPFTVLSAPLRGQPDAAIAGKKAWLDRHNPGTSQTAIFTADKAQFAMSHGRPAVLVDDFGKYLRNWAAAGGIAVKHAEETAAHTIDVLEKIYHVKDTISNKNARESH